VPEGDTVWRSARQLDAALSGKVLTTGDLRMPALATTRLDGWTVLETVSRGKHLLTRLESPSGERWTLHTHLKMEGVWRVMAPGARWSKPAHTARVVLATAEHQAVGFSLGLVDLYPTSHEPDRVGHLGPDLLGPDWDAGEALARLTANPDRGLHEALLDQRNLAGVGNVYASELCFVVGRRPAAPVSSVKDPGRLVALAKNMLEANKERGARTTTGDLRGRRTWVYGYAGKPCRRCGTTIESAEMGPAGQERIAFWCPSCQTG
jgi:endonuclease-8